jgi:phage head maturation protease
MRLFASITKTDDEQRMVYGYASTEALDTQGEIVRKEAIEEALPEYMKFGNVREMHKASAVGVAKEASIDGKGLYLAAKVVDDAAWAKVKEGVYKGFSIGGKALSKLDNVISKLRLSEISLVDRPANPEAVFDVWKNDQPNPPDDDLADPDAEHDDLKADTPAEEDALARYLGDEAWDVTRAVECLNSIYTLFNKEQAEGETGQLASLRQAIDGLKAFIASEIQEPPEQALDANQVMPMVYAEGTGDIEKAGARNSKADSERIQAVHDHATALGANCGAAKSDSADDIQKLVEAETAKAEEALQKLAEATDAIAKLEAEKDTLQKRVAELEAMPEAPKAAVMAVSKGKDNGGTASSTQAYEEELERIVKSQASPIEKAEAFTKLQLRYMQ